MARYYYGNADDTGRRVKHYTLDAEADIALLTNTEDGIGSTALCPATGKKWMKAPSGWTEDNGTGGGGGGGPEPLQLLANAQAIASTMDNFKAPYIALAYMIQHGLLDLSEATNIPGLMAHIIDNAALPDMSRLDFSNMQYLNHMFAYNLVPTSISLATLPDTSNIEGLASFFEGCMAVQTIDLADIDTSGAKDMSRFFYGCTALKTIDLSKLDTSNATTLKEMFYNCLNLVPIDCSTWDTSKCTDMSYMYTRNRTGDKEKTIKAPQHDDRSRTKNCTYMFGSTGTTNGSAATEIWAPKCRTNNASFAFQYCAHVTDLHLDGFDMQPSTSGTNIFAGCSALENIYTDAQTVMPAVSFALSASPALTEQSAVNIFNALPTVTAARTVSLAAATKALLTETDIAIATDKGWTVA